MEELPTDRFFINLTDFIVFLNSTFARHNLQFKQEDRKIAVINKSFDPIRLISDAEAKELKSVEYKMKEEKFVDVKSVVLSPEPSLCLACGLIHPFAKRETSLGDTSPYNNCYTALAERIKELPEEERKEFRNRTKEAIGKHGLASSKASKSLQQYEERRQELEERKIKGTDRYIVSISKPAMNILGFTGNYTDSVLRPNDTQVAENTPQLFQKEDDKLTQYISTIPRDRMISIQTIDGDIICIDMLELYRAKLEKVLKKEPLDQDYVIFISYLDHPVSISYNVIDLISEVIQSTIFPDRPFVVDEERPFNIACRYCSTDLANDAKTFQTFEQVMNKDDMSEITTNFMEFCSSKCFERYREKGEKEFELAPAELLKQFDSSIDKSRLNSRIVKNFFKIITTNELFIGTRCSSRLIADTARATTK